jgi:PAS domain-containing protein
LNRAAAGLLGLPAAEALGLGLDAFCPPESAALLRQRVSASLQAETPAATRLALGPQGAAPQPFWAQFGLDVEGKHCFVVLVQSH